MDPGRAYPVHQLFTHRTLDCVVGWTCVRVCAVGWMDGDERLGLGPRVMDMPHEVTGEGQDDVGTNDGPKRDPVPPGVGPRGRSIRGKQRMPCASSAETCVSCRKPLQNYVSHGCPEVLENTGRNHTEN